MTALPGRIVNLKNGCVVASSSNPVCDTSYICETLSTALATIKSARLCVWAAIENGVVFRLFVPADDLFTDGEPAGQFSLRARREAGSIVSSVSVRLPALLRSLLRRVYSCKSAIPKRVDREPSRPQKRNREGYRACDGAVHVSAGDKVYGNDRSAFAEPCYPPTRRLLRRRPPLATRDLYVPSRRRGSLRLKYF
jgi:hypothetical protein